MLPPSNRLLSLFGFLSCGALLGYSAWLQFGIGLSVCPLCVVQRLSFVMVGAVFLLYALINPVRSSVRIPLGLLAALFSLMGLLVAGRHVWLQGLPPDQVPTCGPGLQYIMETFEPWEALRLVLGGSGECAEVDWRFLGLSIPGWAAVWFSGYLVVGLTLAWRPAVRIP